MPLTEREVGLLWRYHDWLARHGYVLCARTKRLVPGLQAAVSYQPVHPKDVADLLARFMAHEAGDEGGDEALRRRGVAALRETRSTTAMGRGTMAEHCAHNGAHWYLDPCKEAGWRCLDCGRRLGYRPDLDRHQTYRKVSAILHDLHQHEVVYVSNAQEADLVAEELVQHCRETDTYDQCTIARFILAHPALERSAFWRDRAHRWLADQARGESPEAREDGEQKGEDSGAQ